jgi:hypothetical protein
MTPSQDKNDKDFLLNLLRFIISALVLLGSVIAYTETKFATKESYTYEVDQRKADDKEIKELIYKQSEKIDKIYLILLKGGNNGNH